MRKKIYLVLAAALALSMLTACGQKPAEGTNTGAQTAADAGSADNGAAADAGSSDSADATGVNSPENSPAADAGSGDNGGAADAGNEAEQTYDSMNQGEEEVAQDAEQITSETSWSGTYANQSDSVTITAADDGGSFSFIFNGSGIGGTAHCDVNQGIFEGDDGYVVTFNLDVDTLQVSVSNENDESAGDSALAGIYSRQ